MDAAIGSGIARLPQELQIKIFALSITPHYAMLDMDDLSHIEDYTTYYRIPPELHASFEEALYKSCRFVLKSSTYIVPTSPQKVHHILRDIPETWLYEPEDLDSTELIDLLQPFTGLQTLGLQVVFPSIIWDPNAWHCFLNELTTIARTVFLVVSARFTACVLHTGQSLEQMTSAINTFNAAYEMERQR